MKNLFEMFGLNAVIGKSRGLSVQEVANINKETAILFGFTESESEAIVNQWVDTAISFGVMSKNK